METTKGWHTWYVDADDITEVLTELEENNVWMSHIYILTSHRHGHYLVVYKNEQDIKDN